MSAGATFAPRGTASAHAASQGRPRHRTGYGTASTGGRLPASRTVDMPGRFKDLGMTLPATEYDGPDPGLKPLAIDMSQCVTYGCTSPVWTITGFCRSCWREVLREHDPICPRCPDETPGRFRGACNKHYRTWRQVTHIGDDGLSYNQRHYQAHRDEEIARATAWQKAPENQARRRAIEKKSKKRPAARKRNAECCKRYRAANRERENQKKREYREAQKRSAELTA